MPTGRASRRKRSHGVRSSGESQEEIARSEVFESVDPLQQAGQFVTGQQEDPSEYQQERDAVEKTLEDDGGKQAAGPVVGPAGKKVGAKDLTGTGDDVAGEVADYRCGECRHERDLAIPGNQISPADGTGKVGKQNDQADSDDRNDLRPGRSLPYRSPGNVADCVPE